MAKKSKPKKTVKAKKPVTKKKAAVKAKKPVKKALKAKPRAAVKKAKLVKKTAPKPPLNPRAQLEALQKKIMEEKKMMTELWKKVPPQEVADYAFKAHDGSEVKLSEMFGSHKDLILVHNMGKGCRYCTLWADGFIGLTKHLENRGGFVVVSKDDYETQRDFYQSRGWNFKMFSSHDTTFNRDLGFEQEDGGQWPGVSALYKDESGKIFRTGFSFFGPGDDFCALWPMLDLLKDGQNKWEPQYQY